MSNYLLDRYLAGERDGVWAELRALDAGVRDPTILPLAQAAVAEAMRRVRHNVEFLAERLPREGYRFFAPEKAHVPPAPNVEEELAEVERSIGPPAPHALGVLPVCRGNFCHRNTSDDDAQEEI